MVVSSTAAEILFRTSSQRLCTPSPDPDRKVHVEMSITASLGHSHEPSSAGRPNKSQKRCRQIPSRSKRVSIWIRWRLIHRNSAVRRTDAVFSEMSPQERESWVNEIVVRVTNCMQTVREYPPSEPPGAASASNAEKWILSVRQATASDSQSRIVRLLRAGYTSGDD